MSSRSTKTTKRKRSSKEHVPMVQDVPMVQPVPKDEYTVITDRGFSFGSVKPPEDVWEYPFRTNETELSNFLCLVTTGDVVEGKIKILYIDILMNRVGNAPLDHKLQYVLYRLYLLDPNELVNKTLLIDIDSVVRATKDTEEPGFHYDAVNSSVDHPILKEIIQAYQIEHHKRDMYKDIFRSNYTFLHIFLRGKGVGTVLQLSHPSQSGSIEKKRTHVENNTITFFANDKILHSAPFTSPLFTPEGNLLLKEQDGNIRQIQRVQMVFITDKSLINKIRLHSMFTFTTTDIVKQSRIFKTYKQGMKQLLRHVPRQLSSFFKSWIPRSMTSISHLDPVCYAAAMTKKGQLEANDALNIPLQELLDNSKQDRRRIRLTGGKKNKTIKRRRSRSRH